MSPALQDRVLTTEPPGKSGLHARGEGERENAGKFVWGKILSFACKVGRFPGERGLLSKAGEKESCLR